MTETVEYIGFLRYSGKSLEKGYLGARQSAEALIGLDEALRYFVNEQDKELAKFDYDIPVRIRKGTWEAWIPQDIGVYLKPAATIIATAYLASAASKMAQNDFKNASLTALFKRAMQVIQWIIKIGKHLGTLTKRKFEDIEWRDGNRLIGILNENGERLFVPAAFLKFYEQMPIHLLKKIASIVSEEIKLEIAVYDDNEDKIESLGQPHKHIFCPDTTDVLFPELKHGQEVKLEGTVTRGNENTNNIGFQYQGHILTCYPKSGSIVKFKPELFLKCEIKGTISRKDKIGEITELKPKIIFTDLRCLDQDSPDNILTGLFDDPE